MFPTKKYISAQPKFGLEKRLLLVITVERKPTGLLYLDGIPAFGAQSVLIKPMIKIECCCTLFILFMRIICRELLASQSKYSD